jgi:hypothetical protein
VMSVPNPMPGGDPVKFANAAQDATLPGWLTLGSVSVGAAGSGPSPTASSPASPQPSPTASSPSSAQPSPTASSPGSPGPSPAASVAYPATSSGNVLAGGAVSQGCSACSGGTKVGYIGYNGTLTFPDIAGTAAGSYPLVISYVNGGAGREATLTVNGNPVTLDFPGTGNDNWDYVQQLATSVTLKAGTNTIEFGNPGGWAPDIAGITVS